MKWRKENFYHFTGEQDGFIVDVHKGNLGWTWAIIKSAEIIDCAYYHPNAPTSELDAKAKAQKFLNKLLHNHS